MDNNWAAENLQTIRTLMERSAVYRRALAPIMTFAGGAGIAAAAVGLLLKINSSGSFIVYWMVIGVCAVVGVLILVRRQALKQSEPVWSPPTRRIAQALLPALVTGSLPVIILLTEAIHPQGSQPPPNATSADIVWLPLAWVMIYGCGIHAAGFFTSRGIKAFGWLLIFAAAATLGILVHSSDTKLPDYIGHAVMGFFFGFLHLAYGIYLYFTEPRKNET